MTSKNLQSSDREVREEISNRVFATEYEKFKRDERRPFHYFESFAHGWQSALEHSPRVAGFESAVIQAMTELPKENSAWIILNTALAEFRKEEKG